MRLLQLLIAIVFVAVGVGFSALNPDPVTIDLYFSRFALSTGVLVVMTLLVGALVGGAALALGVVLPLRRQLRLARRTSPHDADAVTDARSPAYPVTPSRP